MDPITIGLVVLGAGLILSGCGAKTGLLVDAGESDDGGPGEADLDEAWDALDSGPRPDVEEIACTQTCEYNDCPPLRVPSREYPDIYAALAAAGPGDEIMVGAGTYHLDRSLNIGYCVNLAGAGRESSFLIDTRYAAGEACNIDEPWESQEDSTIILETESSITGFSINSPHPDWAGCSTILTQDFANPRIEENNIDGWYAITATGNSRPYIRNNIISGWAAVHYFENASGTIENNQFEDYLWAIIARGNSFPTIVRNRFLDGNYQITVGEEAIPDIGTETEPGLNLFYETDVPGHWWHIALEEGYDIDFPYFRGNCFVADTYTEMNDHPFPFDVTRIHDGNNPAGDGIYHGNGIVDYRDFGLIGAGNCIE